MVDRLNPYRVRAMVMETVDVSARSLAEAKGKALRAAKRRRDSEKGFVYDIQEL